MQDYHEYKKINQSKYFTLIKKMSDEDSFKLNKEEETSKTRL